MNPLSLSLLSLVAVSASAMTITSYGDFDSWQSAALAHDGTFLINETFAGDRINTPGLTLTQDARGGHIDRASAIHNGTWADCVGKTSCAAGDYATTTLTLNNGGKMYGLWFPDITVEDPTYFGLEVYVRTEPFQIVEFRIAGDPLPYGGYDSIQDASLGFVSDLPFESVMFAESLGAAHYDIKGGFAIADPTDATAAPEPAYLGGFGLLLLALFWRRKNQKPSPLRVPAMASHSNRTTEVAVINFNGVHARSARRWREQI